MSAHYLTNTVNFCAMFSRQTLDLVFAIYYKNDQICSFGTLVKGMV